VSRQEICRPILYSILKFLTGLNLFINDGVCLILLLVVCGGIIDDFVEFFFMETNLRDLGEKSKNLRLGFRGLAVRV
jgi:hypothetical protein